MTVIQPPAAWNEPHALVKDAEQVATDASSRAAELEAISATAAADAARERDAMSAAFSRLETAIESGEDGGNGARPARDDVTVVGVDAAEVERVAASILADAGDDTLARAKGTADADAAAADADASEADAAAAALSAAVAMPPSKKKTRAEIFQEVVAKRAEVDALKEQMGDLRGDLRALLEEQKVHVASLLSNLGGALTQAAQAEMSAGAARQHAAVEFEAARPPLPP